MNLIRFVRSIGLKPVVAGNLKGFYDRYRTPETQREFAERNNQKTKAVTSFADGTKLSMELTVLANATGFGVAKRGMYGPALGHVNESSVFLADKLVDGRIVDFLPKPYRFESGLLRLRIVPYPAIGKGISLLGHETARSPRWLSVRRDT